MKLVAHILLLVVLYDGICFEREVTECADLLFKIINVCVPMVQFITMYIFLYKVLGKTEQGRSLS